MVFFAETVKEHKFGIVGLSAELASKKIKLNPELREFVLPFKSQCGAIETAFNLAFLSKAPSPFGVYIECHGHIEEDQLTHFVISLRRKPDSPPPSELTRTSDTLGGYPSGFLRLLSLMGEQQIRWKSSVKVLVIDQKRWALKFKRNKLPKKIGALRFEEEEIHLEREESKTDVVVAFTPELDSYSVLIKSIADAKINASCFEIVSGQLWSRAKSIFIKK